MDIEKRKLAAGILGGIAFFAVCGALGYIVIKYNHALNIMITLSIIGAVWILAGMFILMISSNSYFPAALILIGLAEQGMMLLIFLKIRLSLGLAAVGGLAIIIFLIYLLDPLKSRKNGTEKKFEGNIISFAEKAEEIRREKESKRTVNGTEKKEVS